jgi:type VI secretion system secreted protein Hcp
MRSGLNSSRLVLGLVLSLAFSAGAGPMFLELEGVPGEATHPSHRGWIVVEGFASGLRPTRLGLPAGQSAATGVGVTGEITCRKSTDKASPKLAEALCKGTVFPRARFEFVTAGLDTARFYRVDLEEVVVTSFQSVGPGGEDRPTEELSLGFGRATWVYTEFAGTGKALADHQFEWDFLRNTGEASKARRGFSASAVVRPGQGLGIRWSPEPGRRYQLLRSQDPTGPYLPVRELEAATSGAERWEELPAGRQLDFFLLRELP